MRRWGWRYRWESGVLWSDQGIDEKLFNFYQSADGGLPSYPDSEMDSSKVKFINGGTADPVGDARWRWETAPGTRSSLVLPRRN